MTKLCLLGFHVLCAVVLLVAVPLESAAAADKPNRPNVLFIAVDDLRPQLACYGQPQMKTPNFDALARTGTLFTRTYCQFSVCGASRASLMTGLRPTATRFRNFASRADHDAPGVVTLPEYFKKHGYYTLAMGKVFHNAEDSPQSWSEPHWSPPDSWPGYHNPATIAAAAKAHRRDKNIFGPPWENDDCPDEGYPDGRTAAHAIADLKRLKEKGQPFFLAVGFSKPHLPFTSPKKYWDLYDHAKIDLAKNPFAPQGAPAAALHQWRELRGNYSGIPRKGPCSPELSRNLIHAYYACVSFADAQVGKLLAELDQLGLSDNTIVIVWGDNGWQLGEHGMWCKQCVFDTSMHVPLIVRAPGFKGGAHCAALTELVDVYPTLCDLSGLEKPAQLEGYSFVPLLKQPDRPWKKAIYGSYGTGTAVRNDRFVYSEFHNGKRFLGRMLYDHETDPGENINIVDRPDLASTVAELSRYLKEGYRSALPESETLPDRGK